MQESKLFQTYNLIRLAYIFNLWFDVLFNVLFIVCLYVCIKEQGKTYWKYLAYTLCSRGDNNAQ